MQFDQILDPCSDEVLFLLTKNYTPVLNTFACYFDKVAVIGTEYAPHPDSTIQLNQIIFTEALHFGYCNDINTASLELKRDLNVQMLVKVEAKDVCFQRLCPLVLWLS